MICLPAEGVHVASGEQLPLVVPEREPAQFRPRHVGRDRFLSLAIGRDVPPLVEPVRAALIHHAQSLRFGPWTTNFGKFLPLLPK